MLNRAQLLLEGLEVTSEPNASNDSGNIVIQGVINPKNYPVNPDDIGWQGLTGVAQGGQPSFAQIAPGGSVNWNSGAVTVTRAATTQSDITANLVLYPYYFYNNSFYRAAIHQNRAWILITEEFYQANTTLVDSMVGKEISGNNFAAGTTISSIGGQDVAYDPVESEVIQSRRINLSRRPTSNSANYSVETRTVTNTFKDAPTSNLFFDKTSWESSQATIGTFVANSDTRFPAGTSVVSVSLEDFNGTEYYDVSFSQSTNSSTITKGTTTVTFDFTEPPYAQPGETIFAFIARPGERSTLDLSFIKELTNTTLGGRGTFPNGPDVLAINVFKTTGSAITGDVILRWSEAQA